MNDLSVLKKLARPRAERCELCAIEVDKRHRHLIDPATRGLKCVCVPCSLLFDEAGKTKLKRVPLDARRLQDLVLPDESWEKLLIPINLAFIYKSSAARKTVALYPSPAGVTESQLELEHWRVLEGANPALASMKEDVEALLVNRVKEKKEYFVAPIDRCFELVGIVRRHWRGFSGGDRVHDEMGTFFRQLNAEARS